MLLIDYFYIIIALAIAIVYFSIAIYALQRRFVPGATALAIIMFAAAGYAIPYIFELASPNLATARTWYNISLPGASIVGPAWLIFSLQYTKQNKILTTQWALLLVIVPILTCLVAWTNPLHNLYGTNFSFDPTSAWPVLKWDFGLFYWINFSYAYVTASIGSGILLITSLRRFKLFTQQTILLLAGAIIPVILNIVFVLGDSPIPNMDVAPFTFLITGVTWSFAIFRFSLLDIVPVAHRQVFETMPIGVIVLNDRGQVVDINPIAETIFGFVKESLIGHFIPETISVELSTKLKSSFWLEHQEEISLDHGSTTQYLFLNLTPLYNGKKKRTGALLLVQDISARKIAEIADQEQRNFSEVLRDTAADINRTLNLDEVLDHILVNLYKLVTYDFGYIVLLDPVNQEIKSFRTYSFYSNSQKSDEQANSVVKQKSLISEMLEKVNKNFQPIIINENEMRSGFEDKTHTKQAPSVLGIPIQIRGELIGLVILESSISEYFSKALIERLVLFANQAAIALENARFYKELADRAVRDDLTGALNRRGLLEQAQFEYKRAQRYKNSFCLIMFDVDHFKLINDQYGHAIGDQILRSVVRQCLANIRDVDTLGRYGGDEFIVLMPECNLENAVKAAERLRNCIANYEITIQESRVHVTLSLGVAAYDNADLQLDNLIQLSDQRLYTAKQAGRNCVRC